MLEIFYNWTQTFITQLNILALPWCWAWRETLFYISTEKENYHKLLPTGLASPFTLIIRTENYKFALHTFKQLSTIKWETSMKFNE